MDDHLQQLVQQLAEALNEAISDSDTVNDALEQLRAAGYPALLVVEATIAFKEDPSPTPPVSELSAEERFEQLSKEDRQFLRSLNIKFDSEE